MAEASLMMATEADRSGARIVVGQSAASLGCGAEAKESQDPTRESRDAIQAIFAGSKAEVLDGARPMDQRISGNNEEKQVSSAKRNKEHPERNTSIDMEDFKVMARHEFAGEWDRLSIPALLEFEETFLQRTAHAMLAQGVKSFLDTLSTSKSEGHRRNAVLNHDHTIARASFVSSMPESVRVSCFEYMLNEKLCFNLRNHSGFYVKALKDWLFSQTFHKYVERWIAFGTTLKTKQGPKKAPPKRSIRPKSIPQSRKKSKIVYSPTASSTHTIPIFGGGSDCEELAREVSEISGSYGSPRSSTEIDSSSSSTPPSSNLLSIIQSQSEQISHLRNKLELLEAVSCQQQHILNQLVEEVVESRSKTKDSKAA